MSDSVEFEKRVLEKLEGIESIVKELNVLNRNIERLIVELRKTT